MNANLTSLIEKHLNATLTAAEAAQLAQAMVDDPAVAEHFASLTRLDADLSGATKEAGRTALYTRRMERAEAETAPAISRRRLAVRTLAAAAGIAVLIGTGWRLIEGSGLPGTFAKKGKSVPAREKSSDDGGFAALAGNHAAADSAAMKRKLRGFFVPMMNVRQLPVSRALAALQKQWKDTNGGAVAFTLADNIRQRWPKPEDEPVVSLEIPGISLLTNLELLAAQSGLKTIITGDGVNLEEDARATDAKERTWTIPLSQATLTAFMRAAGSEADGIAALDSGLQQAAATWNDYGLIHSWFETTPSEQALSTAWGLIPQVQAGDLVANIAGEEQPSVDWVDLNSLTAAQTLTFDLQDTPADPANAASVQFSPDGKQLLTAALNGKVIVWDAATGQPVTPAESYADYVGDRLVDLELAPGVVEFDSFLNNGTPVQFGDTVEITTSGITQPVFATRTLIDHPASLTRLLAAHGMPADGATWNPETGVLTARGTMQSLRAAHAAAAAIRESASAGVAVDMRMIEWKDGQPPPGTNADMILPPAETAVILTGSDAHSLLRQPGASVTSVPRVLAAIGKPVALLQMSRHPASAEAWTNADFNPKERLAGGSFNVEMNVEHSGVSGYETKDGVRSPVRSTQSSSASSKVPDGAWVRIDFPAKGDANATTVLLNIQSAEVHPE